MKVCGLTGGIGMGKSTVAQFLLSSGASVVDTDNLARELVQPGQPALEEIRAHFGVGIIDSAGRLRRSELASIIFQDSAARQKLESILHPRIREARLTQINIWRQSGLTLGFVVIPLLFETHAESEFNKIICVACSPATQRERLMARGWSIDEIRLRAAAQLPIEVKVDRSNFVIWTEGDLDVSRRQVTDILQKI